MTPRTSRRLWFIGLWLMLPFPLPFLSGPWVPAVRYVILATAASLVALVEGGSGPVGMLVALFAVWGALMTACCWLLAWGVGRALAGASPGVRGRVTWACLLLALVIALALEPYSTPFGRAATGGLIEVLS